MMQRASSGPMVVVAMDHCGLNGTIEGLEDPGRVIEMAATGGADAVMTTLGVVKHYRGALTQRVPTYLRLDGGPTRYREEWLSYTEWSLLHSVEDAQRLGVHGVCVMAFLGAKVELETMRILGRVVSECMQAKLPVMVEALPCPAPGVSDPKDAAAMASACRVAFERGADLVKTYYTGTPEGFRQVTEATPVPVLLAGGPRMDTDEAVLQSVADAMSVGCKGVVFGRNIWQHPNPAGMLQALRAVVHESQAVAEARRHVA